MKRQKWLTGVLAVMLVASLLLAVGTFVPIVVSASGDGGGGPEPEEICSSYECLPWGGYCDYQGHFGYWEFCYYVPYPEMCQYCDPCTWYQCHWW